MDSFQLVNGNCVCNVGLYLSGDKCIPCSDNNCYKCSSATFCTQCKDKYYLKNGQCVMDCDQSQYSYIKSSNNFQYNCSSQGYEAAKLQSNNKYSCANFNSYDPGYGCFYNFCRPFEFKLYDPSINSFKCVEACPINYTANLFEFSCIENSCQNDISQLIYGQCFYKTCPLGQYFQSYQSSTALSTCKSINISNCIDHQDVSSNCKKCKPSYFGNYCEDSCIQTFPSTRLYYQLSNSCSFCYTSNPACVTSNYKSYKINNTYYYTQECYEGYYQDQNECIRCSEPNMISCNPGKSPIYVCDWGQDSSQSSCPLLDLRSMKGKVIDYQGIVQNSSIYDTICIDFNPTTQLCNKCSGDYNFNFFGVCSQSFARPTKYYVYYKIDEEQYHVLNQCLPKQFVQKVTAGGYQHRVCKDFSSCELEEQKLVDGQMQTVCQICSSKFYNLNGTCIDDCPSYTYKNTVNKKCETPIENCDTYFSNTSTPYCSQCKSGYIDNKQSNVTKCILSTECPIGQFHNISSSYCQQCASNCAECNSQQKCLKPAENYYLYNNYPVKECPPEYFVSLSDLICKKCGQFCKTCTNENTCTIPISSNYVIIDGKVYHYTYPICSINQYFDDAQKICVDCNPSCAQCQKSSTQCILCSDATQVLHNNQCVTVCPPGYYQTQIQTTHYTFNKCLACDSICLDSLCSNEKSNCTTGCIDGYIFHLNRCLTQCPSGFYLKDSKCFKQCKQGEYNTDQFLCGACKSDCSECSDGDKCTQCKSPLLLQDGFCVTSCVSPYFLSSKNSCVSCGSKGCSICSISGNAGTCTECKIGYKLNELKKCEKLEIEYTPESAEQHEEAKYQNPPITYTGKIYEGIQCHYSCKQCKGPGIDECLSCYLSTRVFYEEKYCLCADGFEEQIGQQKCKEESNNKIMPIIDTALNWILLISISTDRIPVLTLNLIDILSTGSYQVYIENVYNLYGKQSILQTIYQNNFSQLFPNFFQKMYIKEKGAYQPKEIVEADGDETRELPLIFNNTSIYYMINSISYIAILVLFLIVLIILRFLNYEKFEYFINKFLVIFFLFTFQDQILYIGLQFRYLKFTPNFLCISSLAGAGISLLFNAFMIFRIIQLKRNSMSISHQYSEQFNLLFNSNVILISLFVKSANALSIFLLNSSQIRAYIFAGLIIVMFILLIYDCIVRSKKQHKIFTFLYLVFAIESLQFLLPVLLNQQSLSGSFSQGGTLHQLQVSLNTVLIYQKMVIFAIETAALVFKTQLYKRFSGVQVYFEQQSKTEQTNELNFSNLDIEAILNSKQFKAAWSKS